MHYSFKSYRKQKEELTDQNHGNNGFMFTYVLTFTGVLKSLSYCLVSFHFSLRIFFFF